MKNILFRLLLIVALTFSMAEARPTGSSSSSPTPSRSSSPAPSRPSSPAPSRPSTPSPAPSRPSPAPVQSAPRSPSPTTSSPSTAGSTSNSGWGSSNKATPAQKAAAPTNPGQTYTAPKQTTADTAIANKVKQSGEPTVNRSTAVQQKNTAAAPVVVNNNNTTVNRGGNNSGTTTTRTTTTTTRYRYDTRPTVWPMGLPMTYFYMGMMHSLIWDPYYRGYGWYHGNRWYYYDDAYDGYASAGAVGGPEYAGVAPVAGAPVQRADGQVVYVARSSFPWFGFFIGLILFTLLIMFFVWLANRPSRSTYRSTTTYTSDIDDDDDEVVTETVTETTTAPSSYTVPVAPQDRTSFRPAAEVKANPRFFGKSDITRVQPGDVINLSDAISMDDARGLDPKAKALAVTVNNITRIEEKSGFGTYTVIRGVSATGQELLIVVKDVDNNRSQTCYTLDIPSQTRQELIDGDFKWMFAPPSYADFRPMDLNYTQHFNRMFDGQNEDLYELKGQGELHGLATFNPARSGQSELVATIAEYATGRAQPTDQYLIIELGTDNGSTVEGWWGAVLKDNEVSLA